MVLLWVVAVGLAAPAAEPRAATTRWADLPPLEGAVAKPIAGDWLVRPVGRKAGVYRGRDEREIVLCNGLIRRTFRLEPNAATVAFENLLTGASVIRAVKPEALVTLDGQEQPVGGLVGQPEMGYLLPQWIEGMTNAPDAWRCSGFEVGLPERPLEWKRKRPAADLRWPPPGVALTFNYRPVGSAPADLSLRVHYELYDGLPAMGKWIRLANRSALAVTLNAYTSELLAAAEVESVVDERDPKEWRLPALNFLSDYSFRGMDNITASQIQRWLPDPSYTSQVNYALKMPAIAVSRPPIGPDAVLAPGAEFRSHRTYVVLHDSDGRERQGLALRRVQRALAPWATENPIMMHVRNSDSKSFRLAVDQCAAVGFEMIIYTFGSGLDMENELPDYQARIKADVDYAHARGIEVGAYSLLASRQISPEHDVIDPKTGRTDGAVFGHSPCLWSAWGLAYFQKIKRFIEATGLDLLEHDGSYPGDVCASTSHPGHRGLGDSQWTQWRQIADFYAWCRGRGIYLNVPDYYFLAGSSKTAMGYRESNWSLPRERQILLGRQNLYDGTWTKAPSMGWMFVPLVEYQGGGAAATLEPLSEHLDAYAAHLANNFGAGVQACYRGPRLYDTDATQAVVRRWVSWFKEHRAILESDLIHLRRPDGRDLDCFLHVNPALATHALAVVFNPLETEVQRELRLPLYYAGLRKSAQIREQEGRRHRYSLDREYEVRVPVRLPARGITWLVIEGE